MRKSNIIIAVAALTLLATAAGVSSTLAADNLNIRAAFGKFWDRPGQKLTEEQKAEMQTKMDAVKAALEVGDYTAWLTAEKAISENSPILSKVTADNFDEYVANYKEREAKMVGEKAKRDAVNAALEAGDYTAWVAAEKAINENCPTLEKINANNFNRYVEAWKLRQQADSIMEELGIGRGDDMGRSSRGMRGDFGPGRLHNQNSN